MQGIGARPDESGRFHRLPVVWPARAKVQALAELSKALIRRGYDPVFCAPTASAVSTLRKDGLEAVTLAKFLSDQLAQMRLSLRSVIVLDEAGTVGLNDMSILLNVAHTVGCRVVFCGDTGQHASVARGDALRIIEQYSGYRFSELTTIRRQKPEAFRQVVELAAAKETDKAFAKLLELGAVTEDPCGWPRDGSRRIVSKRRRRLFVRHETRQVGAACLADLEKSNRGRYGEGSRVR